MQLLHWFPDKPVTQSGPAKHKETLRPLRKTSILFLPQVLPEKMLTVPLKSVGEDLRSGVAAAISLPQVESLELPMRKMGQQESNGT